MTRFFRLPMLLPAYFLFLLVAWMALPSVAYAQDAGTSPPAVDLSKIVILLCAAVPLGFRALSSKLQWAWPHTWWGAGVLALASSFGAALYALVQAHGFSGRVLELAAYGAIAGLCGAANGSNVANTAATLAARRKAIAAILILPLLTLSACGCFTQSNPKYATKTCVEVRKALDCTANVALDIVSIAGPAIASGLIAGSGFDVGALAGAAENAAPGGGICLLGSIEAALPAPGTTSALPAALVATKFKVHGAAVAHAKKVYNLSVPLDVKVRKADGSFAVVTIEPSAS